MIGFLASVRSLEEARLASAASADLVDMKEPAAGALGALPTDLVRETVALVGATSTTSATTGDLPMTPAVVREAAAAMAATGVDFVKVGLFPGGDLAGTLRALGALAVDGVRLVAVLFADRLGEGGPDLSLVETLAGLGFAGAMVDTAGKARGSLRSCLGEREIGDFVARTRGAGMMVGLAGSLTLADIAPLLAYRPDYLGFRGALCEGGRSGSLSPERLAAVRAAIHQSEIHQPAAASSASTAAGAQRAAQSLTSRSPGSSSERSL